VPADNRIHPLIALRAVRGLLRDREDTRQAFLLVEALRGKTTLRQFARFCASESGRALLAEHPRFRERNREMHDLLHVVAGYGRDPLGEACVLAFTFAQNGSRGAAAIALVGAWRNLRRLRTLRAPRAVWEAYRQGRRALWLIWADWETLLEQPLDEVRVRFRVAAPLHYPQLRERSVGAAAAADQMRLAAA